MQLKLPAAPSPATHVPSVQLLHGDCLDVMPTLEPGSVAMVFADLPYGSSRYRWDTCIALESLWPLINRLGDASVAYIFTATQPFATTLICSQKNRFRYDLVWAKQRGTGHLHAKKKPMRAHEGIYIFSKGPIRYNPQMTDGHPQRVRTRCKVSTEFYGTGNPIGAAHGGTTRYPLSVQNFSADNLERGCSKRISIFHPTQKPVALLEWLIRTYTNEGDTVLDPVFGSCTTAVACLRTGRNFVGIEKDATYFEVGRQRIAAEQARLGLPVTV